MVIGFKVVGCFSGGDRVMGHNGDQVFGSRWWRHGLNRLGLVLCFGGVD